jgi:hypothetical protein
MQLLLWHEGFIKSFLLRGPIEFIRVVARSGVSVFASTRCNTTFNGYNFVKSKAPKLMM